MRYEDSDFVNVWGPDGAYLNLGSVVPSDFHEGRCGELHQIGELAVSCRVNVESRNILTGICAASLLSHFSEENRISVNQIIGNYNEIHQKIMALPRNKIGEIVSDGVGCWVEGEYDIPEPPQ